MIIFLFFCGTMIVSVLVYFKKIYQKSKSKELLIFSRYPTPGSTKTRLIPKLGEECASYVQLLMTNHILDKMEEYYTTDDDITTTLYYYGGTKQQMKYWLDKRKCNVLWQEQPNGGLGKKLASAFKYSFNRGSKYTIVIGSDIPGINSSIIAEAYQQLQNGSDMVLGPAADGGYYLVGISNSKSIDLKIDKVFSDITWGTDTVFKEQTDRAKSLGISLGILETVLSDVDLPEDLHVVEKELNVRLSQIINPTLSIIIPVYNEADNILSTLKTVLKNCTNQKLLAEIIVSDGGSTDDTVSIVKEFSKTTDIIIKVLHSHPGRGYQLKYGTEHATGEYLMFLHADTIVPEKFDLAINKCLQKPGNVAGAFKFSLDILEIPEILRTRKVSKLFQMKMEFIRKSAEKRFRKFEMPYGDQIMFTSRKNYDRVGEFKAVYLLEDYMLGEELRKIGHIGEADAGPAITSSRRWQKWGVVKVSGLNNIIVLAYMLGVPPDTLAEWYYGDKLKEIKKGLKES